MPSGNGKIITGEKLPDFYADKIIRLSKTKTFKELEKKVLKIVEETDKPKWLNLDYIEW
jgi:predicted nucleotide-binding protein (sugar kinase/HSP70/actin superfamily)